MGKPKRTTLSLLLMMILLLAACGDGEREEVGQEAAAEGDDTSVPESGGPGPGPGSEAGKGMGQGMGPGSGMMGRHHAVLPQTYAGLTNPLPVSETALAAGEETYSTYCAPCHGDGGMGDGPAGENLDPPPAPIAHTSQMLGDDYLFWRVSEGGAMDPFNSAMPAWKSPLTEKERWQVITYVRALGRGEVQPGGMAGGMMYDPEVETAQRAQMLAEAVETGLITESEAEVFAAVHTEMDGLTVSGMRGGMATMQEAFLTQLVSEGTITQQEADIFDEVHARLLDAGLMQ